MAAFQQNTQQKSAVRILAIPIADVDAFHVIVQDIIMNNPFGYVSYRTPGINHPPIEKVREMYTAKFVYTDKNGKRVGSGSEVYNSIAGFKAGIAAVTSHIANIAAHGGTVGRNPDADSYAVSLKCHDAGGELFFLNLARDRVTLSSYRDDAIRTRIENWTDGVTALK
jgi:hypothetical protein